MNSCIYKAQRFPDIEMYGGDTTPWEVTFVDEKGKNFVLPFSQIHTCTLSIMPFAISSGIGNKAIATEPTLQKLGSIVTSESAGTTTAIFTFSSDDTKSLRGKYIYQIELVYGSDCISCQGNLLIKQNINRA